MSRILAALCAGATVGILWGPALGRRRLVRGSRGSSLSRGRPTPLRFRQAVASDVRSRWSAPSLRDAREQAPGSHLGTAAEGRTHPVSRERGGPSLAAAGLAGLAAALVVGGFLGIAVGGALAAGVQRWLRGLETRAARERRQRLARDLPSAADLLAACLGAGCHFEAAAEAVAQAVGGPLSEVLRATIAAIRLGGDPVRCWQRLERDPALAPLGRTLARAAASGAPVADAVSRLAEEQRREQRWAAETAARRVGVQAVAPLGLCFLPAFVLLAIVPMVSGLAATVLPGLR